jgi:hypothetical protein
MIRLSSRRIHMKKLKMWIWIGRAQKMLKEVFWILLYGNVNIQLVHLPIVRIGVHQMNSRNFYIDIRKLAYFSCSMN